MDVLHTHGLEMIKFQPNPLPDFANPMQRVETALGEAETKRGDMQQQEMKKRAVQRRNTKRERAHGNCCM